MKRNSSGISSADQTPDAEQSPAIHRRKFLASLGLGVSAAAVLASCDKDDDNNNEAPAGFIDLGRGDVGILNYAYALEQLEAAFYTRVIASPYSGMTSAETALLTDIRDHEVAHRQFFKTALSSNAIVDLEVNFTAIDFSSRSSVLSTAKAFEDLGVSAYNGAGKLIQSADYLLLAGKIVSVEARHAAYIRDLLSNGSFADNTAVDANGLDLVKAPAAVLDVAKSFLVSKLWAGNLPTS
ncbi:ferritin-like domain-containing protein [Nostoc ellipsosporum NOK]|jgi:hypothetical protein|nr:ferritin-like domain-containing protein [Nostoc ellipsosporum NOK]